MQTRAWLTINALLRDISAGAALHLECPKPSGSCSDGEESIKLALL